MGQLGAAPPYRLEPRLLALGGGLLLAACVVGALAGVDPKLGLAAGIGIAFILFVLADLAAGVCVFALVSFLDVLPFGGAALTFSKAVGLLLAVSWIALLVTRDDSINDFLSDRPIVSMVLIGYVAWALLSFSWAEDPGATLDTVYRIAPNVLLLLIVYTAIRTRRHAVWLAGALVAGALVSALYGLLGPGEVTSASEVEQLGGAGVDSNELSALAVMALALACAFAAGWRRSPFVRVGATLAIVGCLAALFMSLSRGGLVALAGALMAAVAFGGRWRPAAMILSLCLALVAVGYFTTVAGPEQRARVTELDGGTGRTDIWTVGWRMVEDKPFAGVGAGNFPVSSIHYLLQPGSIYRDEFIVDEAKVAHNTYLEVLAETGIVGLALFATILAFALLTALGAARRFMEAGDRRMELLSRALAVALVALFVADIFISDQFSKQLWLMLALGPALYRISTTHPEPEAG